MAALDALTAASLASPSPSAPPVSSAMRHTASSRQLLNRTGSGIPVGVEGFSSSSSAYGGLGGSTSGGGAGGLHRNPSSASLLGGGASQQASGGGSGGAAPLSLTAVGGAVVRVSTLHLIDLAGEATEECYGNGSIFPAVLGIDQSMCWSRLQAQSESPRLARHGWREKSRALSIHRC